MSTLRFPADRRTMAWAFGLFPAVALVPYAAPHLALWMVPLTLYTGFCAGVLATIHDDILFQYIEWKLLDHTEEYLQTGKPIDFHGSLSREQWGVYQRGMRALAGTNASEVVARTPIPENASSMLDIGGSHGFYSVALCRRYPELKSTILDLPQAIEHAAPILAAEGMGERVVHQAGDVLHTDLGENRYDAIVISSLVHHFDDATNVDLTNRMARSLKPGGYLSIIDYIRLDSPGEGGQVAWIMNFYFALTSQSGAFAFGDMIRWQRAAGLVPGKSARFRAIPAPVSSRRESPAEAAAHITAPRSVVRVVFAVFHPAHDFGDCLVGVF